VLFKREFEKVLNQRKENLINYLNETTTHPSLVHGDLWSGNYLCDSEKVYLIDPAVYFGDREVDLAMSEMFGGFSPAFYQAYDTAYPRSADYPHKKKIYNLYHYLNHYNLFGQSYLGPCRELFEIL
jgi:fructosamine-3-kinase